MAWRKTPPWITHIFIFIITTWPSNTWPSNTSSSNIYLLTKPSVNPRLPKLPTMPFSRCFLGVTQSLCNQRCGGALVLQSPHLYTDQLLKLQLSREYQHEHHHECQFIPCWLPKTDLGSPVKLQCILEQHVPWAFSSAFSLLLHWISHKDGAGGCSEIWTSFLVFGFFKH